MVGARHGASQTRVNALLPCPYKFNRIEFSAGPVLLPGIRWLRASQQPQQQTYCEPQEENDQRQRCERCREREQRDEKRAGKLGGCDHRVAETTREDGGFCPQHCGHALRDAGNAACW